MSKNKETYSRKKGSDKKKKHLINMENKLLKD